MASHHFRISDDEYGDDYWEFKVNPLDMSGTFPDTAYTAIHSLSGQPMLQFPEYDTRLRSMKWDIILSSNELHSDFVVGADESDVDSLLYLKKLDADGQLTTYWLHIPEKRLRPEGWREIDWIPIRVEDLRPAVMAVPGDPRWQPEMVFRIVPKAEALQTFKVQYSPLDGNHYLVTSKLGKVYTYDATGPTFTDRTDEAYAGGSPFPTFTVVAGDRIIMGCRSKFYGVKAEMDTPETVEPDEEQGATKNAWKYWNGSSWASCTISDLTEGFTKTACVTWSSPSAWTAADLSQILTGAPSTVKLYWVLCEVGTVSTGFDFNKLLRA